MQNRDKIKALRALMQTHRLDAYYVPSVDPHSSEYVPECWLRRGWLSGFTGSAGDLLVLRNKAGLWTDSRYWLQAAAQLAGSGVDLFKHGASGVPSLVDFACSRLKKGQVLGVDPRVMSLDAADEFESALGDKGIKVKYVARNLVDQLWKDQPAASDAPVRAHGLQYSGENTASKLKRLRLVMKSVGAKAHVIGALDVIAWLFNIRSRDIEYTPVTIAYAVVTDRDATIYLNETKVGKAVRKGLSKSAKIKAYEKVTEGLSALNRKKVVVLVDPSTTNRWLVDQLKSCTLLRAPSPVVFMKSIKNGVQNKGIKAAHVRDGVAMVKFIKWLQKAVPAGGITEISASEQLRTFREEQEHFQDESFGAISGYAGHGAIVHYSATPETDIPLKARGVYLIDSGGQYLDGTTDITRTLRLGDVSKRAKRMFTRVLQGNINLTRTPFPAGTTGLRLEILARQALLLDGANYGHGTGHGVGHYLGVHEGPMSVSPREMANAVLHEGQFLSIEPGHYEAGKFGIRIENLAFVAKDEKRSTTDQNWLFWDVVTLCPIDKSMIEKSLMTRDEILWLNDYHTRVYRELSSHLDAAHKAWLKKATKPI